MHWSSCLKKKEKNSRNFAGVSGMNIIGKVQMKATQFTVAKLYTVEPKSH
jgi:hypothetical protein